MVDISVEFAGISFKNPLIVGSATPTKDAKAIKKAIDAGFGGVIVKSLFGNSASIGRRYPRPRFKLYGWKEFPGYPKRQTRYFTLQSLEDASTYEYNQYVADINLAKSVIGDAGIVIASIAGSSTEEWEDLCTLINGSNADMCELNISCPFAADMVKSLGAGASDFVPEIIKVVKNQLAMPFSAKLSPQVPDLPANAKAAELTGANAVTIQARLSGIMIDIDTAKPIGWGSIGGYGGPYLLGYGLKGVSDVAKEIKIPISAVLGVWDWEDIIKYLMVGATTVQSATAVIVRGFRVAQDWLQNISSWMERKGYDKIQDFQGAALKNIISTKEVIRAPTDIYVEVHQEKCIGCGECKFSCFYDAVSLNNGKASINKDVCDVCGLCYEKCPTNAINLIQTK